MSWKKHCCVPGCGDFSKAVGSGIHFHRFPRDNQKRREWLLRIDNPDIPPSSRLSTLENFRVCGKHFTASDYEDDVRHRLAPHLYGPSHNLRPGAVPSIMPLDDQDWLAISVSPSTSNSSVSSLGYSRLVSLITGS